MNSRYYILKGKTPVPADSRTWGYWFNEADRIVARDQIGNVLVSTVFLGLDHRHFGHGPPLLFETMTFGGPRDETTFRYSSWDDAVTGHATEVKRVKNLSKV